MTAMVFLIDHRSCISRSAEKLSRKENALYLSVNVFSTKVLTGDTFFTSPTGGGTAILLGNPSHEKT